MLLAGAGEWLSRAVESVLEPRGYRVIRASNAAETFERVRTTQPDIILLDAGLRDRGVADVCRALFEELDLPRSVPVVVTSSTGQTREERLDALRAGAIDAFRLPMDAEELVSKLSAYLRVKVEVDHAWEASLVDSATALYNGRGLARRAREMGADAVRRHASLACVAFGAIPKQDTRQAADSSAGIREVAQSVAEVLITRGRVSDTIGRVGHLEFAVLAPATSAEGIARLAHRMLEAIEAGRPAPSARGRSVDVHAGYDIVADPHAARFEPEDLLAHASRALHSATSEPGPERIQRYDGIPG